MNVFLFPLGLPIALTFVGIIKSKRFTNELKIIHLLLKFSGIISVETSSQIEYDRGWYVVFPAI